MAKRLFILIQFILLLTTGNLFSQTKSAFSGDHTKFRAELIDFMGPNLKPEQVANLNKFLSRWDSAAFNNETMDRIIDVSSQLSSRQMRPLPHFYDFLMALNSFTDSKRDNSFFTNWLKGLSELVFNQLFTNDKLDRYFKNSSLLVNENVLFESESVKWKVKNSVLNFTHDTAIYVSVTNATLTCFVRNDSTEIYNVTGKYYPETQQFAGTKGIVTWEKAGYSTE